MDDFLAIGTKIKEYGKIVAVGYVGERYYWLIKKGVVSMIPASVIEKAAVLDPLLNHGRQQVG